MFKPDRMVRLYRDGDTEPAIRICKLIGTGSKVAASVVKMQTDPVIVRLSCDADFDDFVDAFKLTGLVEH